MRLSSIFLAFILTVSTVAACGGRDIYLGGEAVTEKYSKAHGRTLGYDEQGNLVLEKEDIRISRAIADQILREYLDAHHPEWEEIHYEVLDMEHGRPVYMYSAHVPGTAITYHVGGGTFVTDHAHYHVDAITGELLDVGCGGGPSKVLSSYEAQPMDQDFDRENILPGNTSYFYTHFVVPVGKKPVIDGSYNEEEWADANKHTFRLGTAEEEVVSYGCGGAGKEVSTNLAFKEVILYSKIVEDNIYFAVDSDSDGWVGLMFKDFPHHGMVGDFGDVKILTDDVYDYYLSSDPKSTDPEFKARGTRGCNGYGKLYADAQSNIISSAKGDIYEFSMPLSNNDEGDTHWQNGQAYQMAVLLGPTATFRGLDQTVLMSTQETLRLGEQRDYDFSVHNEAAGSDDHDHSAHEHEEDHEEQHSFSVIVWIKSLFG